MAEFMRGLGRERKPGVRRWGVVRRRTDLER